MALALEESLAPSRPAIVAGWVNRVAEKELARRQALIDAAPSEEATAAATVVAAAAAPATAPVVVATGSGSSSAPVLPVVPYRKWVWVAGLGVVIALVAARWIGEPAAGAGTGTKPAPSTSTSAVSSALPAPVASEAPATPVVESATRRLASPVISAPPRATGHAVRDAAPAASAGHCVPYFVDSAGVRRFNRDCLE
jgi:hypothetical protein